MWRGSGGGWSRWSRAPLVGALLGMHECLATHVPVHAKVVNSKSTRKPNNARPSQTYTLVDVHLNRSCPCGYRSLGCDYANDGPIRCPHFATGDAHLTTPWY